MSTPPLPISSIPLSKHTSTPSHMSEIVVDLSQTKLTPIQHKLTVKSNLNSFDKVLSGISQALHNRNHANGWTHDVVEKVEALIKSLSSESQHYLFLAKKCGYKDRTVRTLQLMATGVSMYINTSNIEDGVIRHVNIGMSIFVGLLGGLEGIFKFNKHEFQYKEIALSLEGLSRTLRSQLLLAPQARREPGELVLFVENTRDKMLKKLLE
jgi:hypothetical protein